MTYRPRLEPAFSARMNGLPDNALDVVISVVADICTDPYDRMTSMPRSDDTPAERIAELGDHGFLEFWVEDEASLVHLVTLRLDRLNNPGAPALPGAYNCTPGSSSRSA